MPEPTERKGYVYDYATGQFILVTPEEVKAREEWYAQYGTRLARVPATPGIEVPRTAELFPSLTPSTPLSAPVQEYLMDAARLAKYWQEQGYLTPAQAKEYYDQVVADITQSGLTSKTFMNREIAQWKERERLMSKERATPENMLERKRKGIEERIAAEKALEAERVPAMADYIQRKYDILSNSELSYQRKDAALRNLAMGMRKAGLSEGETTQLYYDAKLLAFQQLSSQEQAGMQAGAIEASEAQAAGMDVLTYRKQKAGKTPEQLAAEEEQKRRYAEVQKWATNRQERIAKL